jgi:Lrp/AsnC family transcriptional regulator for asnA, asnC and gidA
VILHVIAEDTDHLRELMFDRIVEMDGFARSQTMVVLGTDYKTDGPPV